MSGLHCGSPSHACQPPWASSRPHAAVDAVQPDYIRRAAYVSGPTRPTAWLRAPADGVAGGEAPPLVATLGSAAAQATAAHRASAASSSDMEAAATVPDDPSFPSLWHLQVRCALPIAACVAAWLLNCCCPLERALPSFASRRSSCGQAISAPDAWAMTTGSSRAGICVIDTGARVTHEDLRGNIRGSINRWVRGRGCPKSRAARAAVPDCMQAGSTGRRDSPCTVVTRTRACNRPAGCP